MKTYRLAVAAIATLLTVACAKNDKAAADSASAAAATLAAAPRPTTMADFAGKWNMRSVPESGDTTPTTYVLTATADTAGWMIEFPSGLKVPVHPMVMGDSLMISTPVYASQRRKGVKVMTEGYSRLDGGKLVGHTVAHYQSKKDSVLRLRVEGTKQP